MQVNQKLTSPSRILIIKLGAFGDLIMAEGVMRCIRQNFPQAHITLITEPIYARFMARAPHFDDFIAHKREPRWHIGKQRALRKRLLQGNFDTVIDLQNSSRSAEYRRWLKHAFVSGKPRSAERAQRASGIEISSATRLAEQMVEAGIDVSQGYQSDIRWAGDPVAHLVKAAGLEDGFVLLMPGSSVRHPQKRWPYFAELCQQLAARDIQVATAPGPDELDLCAALPATMLLDDGKPLTFNQLVGLAPHCSMVVGNDTGPTHLLAAADTSGVALFGGFSPPYTTGIDAVYTVLEKPDISAITVDAVVKEVEAIYAKSV